MTANVELDISSLHPWWWRFVAAYAGGQEEVPDLILSITIGDVAETYRLDSAYQVSVFDEMGAVYRISWRVVA